MDRSVGVARHLVCVLVVAGAVAFLYRDLLDDRGFNSHEQYYTYMRADQVAKEFVAGRVPQAFPDALSGAGFAFPRFYPPFSLWLSAGLGLLAGDTCFGVNLTFFLSALASGVAMYFAAWTVARDRRLALAAALVYVSVPYRFVDVFARGALAEAWTFAWFPIVLAGLWHAVTRRVLPWYLPVGVAGLLLTHNITALYFLCFCGAFVLAGWRWHGRRAAALAALGLALGGGLALWFMLPQQYYMRSVWVSDPAFMWADSDHVTLHRVMPWQFFYSHPRLWFGESHSGEFDDGMSFELGAGQLLVVLAAHVFVRARRRGLARRRGRLLALGWLALGAWVACVAFMMWPAVFLAVLPRQFAYVQFPWRLLASAAFFSAVGVVAFARSARLSSRAKNGFVVAGLLLVATVPAFERTKWTEPEWTDAGLLGADSLREAGGLGFTVLGEYLPRDFDVEAYEDGKLDPARFDAPRVVGEGALVSWDRDGLDVRAAVDARDECVLELPLIYYDFYGAADGRGRRLETFSSDGFLAVRVPAGAGSVAITQRLTPVSIVGLVASAVAAALTVCFAVAFRRRPRRAPPKPAPLRFGGRPDGAAKRAVAGRG